MIHYVYYLVFLPQTVFVVVLAFALSRRYPKRTKAAIYARVAGWSFVGSLVVGIGGIHLLGGYFDPFLASPAPRNDGLYILTLWMIAAFGAFISAPLGVALSWAALVNRTLDETESRTKDAEKQV